MNMVVTADWHLRDSVPKCLSLTQTEWYELQEDMLNQIGAFCLKKDADLYVVGDIFDSNDDCSFRLIQMVQTLAKELSHFNLTLFFIAGNHDEKYHDKNLTNSAIGILLNSENCCLIENDELVGASNFGEEPNDSEFVFIHTLTMPSNEKPSYIECETPQTLAQRFKNARAIFVGDYHRFFTETVERSFGDFVDVMNCGCTLIEKADFVDYEPRVTFYNTDYHKAECWCLDTSLYKFCKTEKKDNSEMVEELTSKLSKEQITLDYQNNLEKAIESESDDVQKKVRSWF